MTVDDATVTRLARMAQTGDRQAYATLLIACRTWLLRYFRRKVAPEQMEDLVQETLISVHKKLRSYDPGRPFLPWLAAIARYRFVDHLRNVYRTAAQTVFDENAEASSSSDEQMTIARISLERLFEELPDAQQRVIELVKIDGLTVKEASTTTGQSEALVKVNIHRGLKRLASMIERA